RFEALAVIPRAAMRLRPRDATKPPRHFPCGPLHLTPHPPSALLPLSGTPMTRCLLLLLGVLVAPLAVLTAPAADAPKPGAFDWPQWQGQDRTAVSKEKGLLKEWPKGGPKLLWSVKALGGGYSTPSVAAGRIFGMSARGKDEGVWALSEKDGKELWWTRIA